jgi:hypothetical protein
MAIHQSYRKLRETDQEVEYSFGFPAKDRRLTFHLPDHTFSVADEREDHAVRAVVRGIVGRYEETGAWPKGGGVQH